MKFTELVIGQRFYFEGDPAKEENVKVAYGHYQLKQNKARKLKVLIPSTTKVVSLDEERKN